MSFAYYDEETLRRAATVIGQVIGRHAVKQGEGKSD